MNKITATGRLAADAEIRYTAAGDAVLGFRLASDVGYGERKSTNWFSCQVWGKRGESLAPMLTKGTPITAFGTLTLREWTDREGQKRLSPDIRIDEITLHGSRDSGAQNENHAPQRQQPRAQAPQTEPDDDLDEIPF